jgi:two-component system chemotaxis response regulator CheB
MVRQVDMSKASNISDVSQSSVKPQNISQKSQHFDLIVLASSTGGVERLRHLIAAQKTDLPPMLIVQHINHKFVPSMVERMTSIAPPHLDVKVAKDLVFVKPNTIYFADNEKHLTVVSKAGRLSLRLVEGPARNGFIASADYLFESAAQVKLKSEGKMDILGIILSGMGNDGAKGALQLKNTDINVIGENQESCLVYGMSKAAKELGAIKDEFSIQKISSILNNEIALG